MEYKPSFSDSLYADIQPSYMDSLVHHGIKGQKWGVRRFQNPDGSYTSAGKSRYSSNRNSQNDIVKKAAIGLATAGAIAGGAYLTSQVMSNKKLVSAINAELKEATNAEQKAKSITKKEVEFLKQPNLTSDQIQKSYSKVMKATEHSIDAERNVAQSIHKAERRHIPLSKDVKSFQYRSTDEYIPHDQILQWFDQLVQTHPDEIHTYRLFMDEWIYRKAHRAEEMM